MNSLSFNRFNSDLRLPALLSFTLVLLIGCASTGTTDRAAHAARYPLHEAMRAEMSMMSVVDGHIPARPTPLTREFYAEVTADLSGVRHDSVLLPSLGDLMVVHLFYPDANRPPTGTVVMLHGYLGYPIHFAPLIRAALQEGYLVVAPELPGHGISGGERGAIDDFADYAQYLEDLLHLAGPALPRPWHAVGLSTGAATIFEYLHTRSDPFGAVVLAAPLVRSAAYGATRFLRFFSRPFLTTVRTAHSGLMAVEWMPVAWFDAQVEWNRRIAAYQPLSRPVLVLQGDADRVVKWRYNRRFLTRQFPEIDYRLIAGGTHVLYRDEEPVRSQMVDATMAQLRGR